MPTYIYPIKQYVVFFILGIYYHSVKLADKVQELAPLSTCKCTTRKPEHSVECFVINYDEGRSRIENTANGPGIGFIAVFWYTRCRYPVRNSVSQQLNS